MHVQIFRGLCEVTVFGRVVAGAQPLPVPLHRCDIYGSKRAGNLLTYTFLQNYFGYLKNTYSIAEKL